MNFFKPVKIKHNNIVEHVVRRISGPLARILAKTAITPDQVTLCRIPLMAFVFVNFIIGLYPNLVCAAIGIIIYEILDCADGDLAVLRNQSSQKGAWLENIIDEILGSVSGFLGLAMTIGIYRQMGNITPWIVYSFVACGWYLFKNFLHLDVPLDGQNTLRNSFLEQKESTLVGKIGHFFYYWVELFIIPAVILYIPIRDIFHINSLFLLMIGYAVMYNLFWITIVLKQNFRFKRQ